MSGQVSQELIEDLVEIGRLQNDSPSSLEGGKHSDLGLHVQMHSRMGMTSLKAGGRFFSKVELSQERPGDNWRVRKYKPGDWERLIKPTLEYAKWVHRLIWEQEAMNEQAAPLEAGNGDSNDSYDAWLFLAKNHLLLSHFASARLAIDQFKRTGVLTLPHLEDLDWIKTVTGIGVDLSKIRNKLDAMVSDMTDIMQGTKAMRVADIKSILMELDDLHDSVVTLHENLRTLDTPEQVPQMSKDFRSTLLSVFLYSSSKVRASQEFYNLLLESNGLVESQKEIEFLTAMGKWLGAHSTEEGEISESLLALARVLKQKYVR